MAWSVVRELASVVLLRSLGCCRTRGGRTRGGSAGSPSIGRGMSRSAVSETFECAHVALQHRADRPSQRRENPRHTRDRVVRAWIGPDDGRRRKAIDRDDLVDLTFDLRYLKRRGHMARTDTRYIQPTNVNSYGLSVGYAVRLVRPVAARDISFRFVSLSISDLAVVAGDEGSSRPILPCARQNDSCL